jgi:phage terminase large subunit
MTAKHNNGSVIIVSGLDDQERIDKILGNEFAIIFLNEATQLNWNTVQLIKTRLSQNVNGLINKLILDCNPKHTRHWLYRAGVQFVDPDTGKDHADKDKWLRMHWTSYDNNHLSRDFISSMESLTGIMRKRMLEGVWCDNDGAVYDEFNEDLHIFSDMPAGFNSMPKYRAIDFGYTNPFVCLWAAVDGDGRIYIYREYHRKGVICEDHAAHIKQVTHLENPVFTVADHDAEDRATLNRHGIPTRAAKKDVGVGIQAVKKRLVKSGDGRPRLYIHESCKNLISEMFDYQWAPIGDGKASKEEPLKVNDHCQDALRYLVMEFENKQGCEIFADQDDRRYF